MHPDLQHRVASRYYYVAKKDPGYVNLGGGGAKSPVNSGNAAVGKTQSTNSNAGAMKVTVREDKDEDKNEGEGGVEVKEVKVDVGEQG